MSVQRVNEPRPGKQNPQWTQRKDRAQRPDRDLARLMKQFLRRVCAKRAGERGNDKQPKPDTKDDGEKQNLIRQDVNEQLHERPFPQELTAGHRKRRGDASLLRAWRVTRLMVHYSSCVHQKFFFKSRPVQMRDLFFVTVEHERGLFAGKEAGSYYAFAFLAPARVIDIRIHVCVETYR